MSVCHLRAMLPLALSLALASTVTVAGQAANPSSTTAATATSALLPASDFARHATVMDPRLSPDGKHLLVRMDGASGKEHALVVYQLSNMSITSELRMPVYELPLDPMWVNNQWIVLEIGKKFGSLDKPLNTGQVIASNINGKKQRYLFGDNNHGRRATTRGSDQGDGFIAGRPAIPNGHVYIRAKPWGRNDLSILYDVDVPHNTRHLMADMQVSGMNFLVNAKGKVKYAFGDNAKLDYVAYHHVKGAWRRMNPASVGNYFNPIAFTPDQKHIYALWSGDGGPRELVEEDPDGGHRKILAKNAFASMGGLQWTSQPMRPFAAVPQAGIPRPVFFDRNKPDAKIYRALQKVFPGKFVEFINFSQDGGELLFGTRNDRDPGTYYLLNTHTYKVTKLFDVAPWIKPAQMARRTPIRFKASNGVELGGFLTFPLHRARKNLPMVLMPHGGPYNVRDKWQFDWDAQFLANRGYLVLQVNYRGSAGRGAHFQQAGFREWGTGIQQDLIDGVKWAIAKHYADPNRICVYGGSFGGYSALMTVIRAPHLFKCAIGYAGVYDLKMMFHKGNIQSTPSGKSYLTTVLGTDPATLAANSPVDLVDKIDVPVFLVHGKDDKQAPYDGAREMRDAMEKAHKPLQWMAVGGERHGFFTEKHRIALYARMQAFLKKYIGPGAPVQAGE